MGFQRQSHRTAAEQLKARAQRFSVSQTLAMMKEALSVFPEQRLRLLVSGMI